MNRFFLLLLSLLFSLFVFSCSRNKTKEIIKDDPIEIVEEKEEQPSNSYQITDLDVIVENSSCASYSFKNRGKAPIGYLKGVARGYAKSLCYPSKVTSSTTHFASDKDALAYYGLESNSLNTYTFLIGLGMRESSGKHCVGRDTTASNTTAETAETGLFQFSYNSRVANSELPEIFNKYLSGSEKCNLDIFSKGITCSSANWSNFGTGKGFEFQKLAKECPAFAVEYGATTIRTLRKHFGPITRKEVEFKAECKSMLKEVKVLIEKSPELCTHL